jgi:hypothetical protein
MALTRLGTNAITTVPNSAITLDAAEIPNLDTAKITTGTFADARIASSNVTQHASTFDDNKIVNDISTIALRQASNENKSAYNTQSMFVDVFQDSTGIASNTNAGRHADEYVSSSTETADSAVTFSYTGSDQTYTPSGKSKMDVVMWGAGGAAGYDYSSSGGAGRHNVTGGAGGFTSGTVAITGTPTYKLVVGGRGEATDVVNGNGNYAYGGGGRARVSSHAGIGGGGGGYSGLFLTSVAHGNSVLIAGGGAGANGGISPQNVDYAGNGGGSSGQDGGLNSDGNHTAGGNGKGGTQSAGGVKGNHGSGYANEATDGSALQGGNSAHMSGAAGGGYYGGGGGSHTGSAGGSGSGGGSGYIGHSSVSNGVTTGSTHTNMTGDKLPPQTSHSLYTSGIGVGGNQAHGGHGKIVITPYTFASNATGNFISNAITASSSTNKMGAIITYQDFAGTNALNTDIILQLSADNGSNFTTATLVAMPDFATGIKMCKVNDLTIGTAGTQLKYKILFANQAEGSKEARIRGVSLQY